MKALYRLLRLRLQRHLRERERRRLRRILQRWSRIPNKPTSHFDQATKRKLELR